MDNNKKSKEKIVSDMQKVVEQMRLDDIEENPDIVNDFFECDCCGKTKCFAGSIQYDDVRLCNDCVLLAETGFELGKIKDVQDLIVAMEDSRLEELCKFIQEEEKRQNS